MARARSPLLACSTALAAARGGPRRLRHRGRPGPGPRDGAAVRRRAGPRRRRRPRARCCRRTSRRRSSSRRASRAPTRSARCRSSRARWTGSRSSSRTPRRTWPAAGAPSWTAPPTAGGCRRWPASPRAASPPTSPSTARCRPDADPVRGLPGAHRGRPGLRVRPGGAGPVRRWARDNGLALFFGAIFLAALAGQALVGHSDFNHQQLAHQDATISLGRYVTSSSFAVDVMENWQSEYLQFTLYVLATVWLVQRGSTESKEPGDEGGGSDEEQRVGEHALPDSPSWAKAGDWRTVVYSNSLVAIMTDDLAAVLVRDRRLRPRRLQRRAARPPRGRAQPLVVPGQLGLLEPHPPELAVGVPRGRLVRRLHGVPAPARVLGVQARRDPAHRDGRREQLARRLR